MTQNADVHGMSQMIGSLVLPRPEVPVFGGDPMEYCTFIRSFDNLIEDKTTSDSSRLHYLVQYTTGDVQQLMKSCLTMEPTLGYSEARTLLKKRYGQSYHIAAAYVDKITKGTAIKSEDRSSLQSFSVLLTSCSNTLKNIGYMSKIENPDSLRSVISRLPYDLRKRWRARVDRITQHREGEIVFQDIVNFVEEEARMVSHPVFGDMCTPKEEIRRSSVSIKPRHKSFTSHTENKTHDNDINLGNKARNDNVQVGANVHTNDSNRTSTYLSSSVKVASTAASRKCALCDKTDHTLEDCCQFKVMPMSARFEFVRKRGLCFNCLIPHHRVHECRKRTCHTITHGHIPKIRRV